MPDLSIIIVSFNTKKILKQCLSSVYRHTQDLDLEVIVIDNNSDDLSPQMVKKNFPKVKLVENKDNRGFGAANNQGVALAKAEYILLLNSDTYIFDDAISRTLNFAKSLQNPGAVSCRLLNSDHSIQPSGGFFPDLLSVFTWQFGLDDLPLLGDLLSLFIKPIHPKISFYQKSPKEIGWITGAFMLIPTKVYKSLKGFDEKIFMYAEELELCFRIHQKNLAIHYYPGASIIHLGGQSAGAVLSLPSEIKGIKYFFNKHYPKWQGPVVSLFFLLGCSLRYLAFGIILNDAKKGQIYRLATKVALTA